MIFLIQHLLLIHYFTCSPKIYKVSQLHGEGTSNILRPFGLGASLQWTVAPQPLPVGESPSSPGAWNCRCHSMGEFDGYHWRGLECIGTKWNKSQLTQLISTDINRSWSFPIFPCLLRCQHVAGQHCYSDLAEGVRGSFFLTISLWCLWGNLKSDLPQIPGCL